ncbi:efflux RND transporter periplasmic adaptor subunit [Myxococcota bacterium]|nr:efflux RND transporter periplasmic adaptor subunit [Myxococcota bacterium]
MKLFLLLPSLSIVFLAAACADPATPKADLQKSTELTIDAERLKRSGVEIAEASGGELKRTLPLLGNIVPNEHNTVKVVAGIGGIVREIPVKVGDLVPADAPLAVIESKEAADVAFQYLEQQQRSGFAKQAYDREKTLLEKQIGTRESYQNAQNDLRKSYLDLQLTTQKLKLLGLIDETGQMIKNRSKISSFTLKSPIEGTLTSRHAVRGEFAPADRELFVLMNLSSVWLEVKAPQTAVKMAHVGQVIQVTNEGLGVRTRSVVVFVSPIADATSRTVLVRLLLANPDGQWRPGICATAEFIDEKKTVPVRLPREAVVTLDDQTSVFVETRPGVFTLRRVVTGLEDSLHVEITHGLNPGERVVTHHALFLKGEWLSTEH